MSSNHQYKSSEHTKRQKKSKAVAFMLCLTCGALGAHRFYVGKKASGFVMLILTLILIVWGLKKVMVLSGNLHSLLADGSKLSINRATHTLASSNPPLSSGAALLAWVGIALVIWALVDLIRIALGNFTDNTGHTLH